MFLILPTLMTVAYIASRAQYPEWLVLRRGFDAWERLLTEAREESVRLASEQEVVRRAERQAEEILRDAEARSREIRYGAEDYADEVLGALETSLDKFLSAVQRGRERLQGRPAREE